MKRILSLLIGLTLMVGCAPKQEDLNTITLWHWMVDRQNALEQLAAQYEQETGIKVKIDLFAPPEAYTQRVIASSQAKALRDIFGILDKKQIFATFIENGFVADLTDEFKKSNGEWESSLFPKALEVNVFTPGNIYNIRPGIYGVPIDVTNIQMLYNKALLEKAGISKAPKTFNEQVDDFRRGLISEALAKHDGNQLRAAHALGIDRATVKRVLERST